jgi:hypothetical protein
MLRFCSPTRTQRHVGTAYEASNNGLAYNAPHSTALSRMNALSLIFFFIGIIFEDFSFKNNGRTNVLENGIPVGKKLARNCPG